MSWSRALYDVYDAVSGVEIDESDNRTQLIPVGFTKKKIRYEIILTATGEFSSVNDFGKNGLGCIVPSSPAAEVRGGIKYDPFPLADHLKYFVQEDTLKLYLAQLDAWCSAPGAPPCLRTLYAYLSRGTLLDDMSARLKKIKLHKDENAQDFEGTDAKVMVCFSVETYDGTEMRLWMREDVRQSWSALQGGRQSGEAGLCYVTGKTAPLLENHPKVQGNAKLISAKDAGYPFQYRGRFVEERSAATVSADASDRIHRALAYLMENQGFRKYGLNIVAWNVATGAIEVPVNGQESDDEDDEDEEKSSQSPDTFEEYGRALSAAAAGKAGSVKEFEKRIRGLDSDENEEREAAVSILSMEAATDGRMSINYYQELPGGVYVERLIDWYRSCCWTYWDKESGQNIIRTPQPMAIARAVMGVEAVCRAEADKNAEKSDAKQLRVLYKRLLSCIVDGAPLPRSALKSAVNRAEAPLTFRSDPKYQRNTHANRAKVSRTFPNDKGSWRRYDWEICVRTTCALIRRSRFDRLSQSEHENVEALLPQDRLDRANRNRSYLYGRLLAIADRIELEVAKKEELNVTEVRRDMDWMKADEKTRIEERPTNALRLMQRFVQRPKDTWLHLHDKLIPALASLGEKADRYMRMISDVEVLFEREDRESCAALDENVLLGFFAQSQAVFAKREKEETAQENAEGEQTKKDSVEQKHPVYTFGTNRSERFGMLAAIADCTEYEATQEKRDDYTVSTHGGKTAALRMMVQMTQKPASTWAVIHSKLLPYLEKLGIRGSGYLLDLMNEIECGFDRTERQDNAPLDSLFLYGFYRMRACIRYIQKYIKQNKMHTLDYDFEHMGVCFLPRGELAEKATAPQALPATRESAYAALLAIENRVERTVLDMEKDEKDNRVSNAVRFMNQFASAPDSTWRYIEARMEPYLKKLRSKRAGKAREWEARIGLLKDRIEQNGWGGNEPLSPEWLHDYYMD